MSQLHAYPSEYPGSRFSGGDGHPEPLIEGAEYQRPHPGWHAVRAWHIVPMHLRVHFHHPIILPHDPPDPSIRMTGTFQHPSPEYIQEISRQLLAGERNAWLSAIDSQRWITRIPLYTETCRWGGVDHGNGAMSAPILNYALWAWNTDTQRPELCSSIPSDIFRATWEPTHFWGLVPSS